MINGATIADSLEHIKQMNNLGNCHPPTIDELQEIWRNGKQRGKIVILEGKQKGDAARTKVGMIVSTDDGLMIRIALSADEAINLARALVSSAS